MRLLAFVPMESAQHAGVSSLLVRGGSGSLDQ